MYTLLYNRQYTSRTLRAGWNRPCRRGGQNKCNQCSSQQQGKQGSGGSLHVADWQHVAAASSALQ
jgi:hypothetical protein